MTAAFLLILALAAALFLAFVIGRRFEKANQRTAINDEADRATDGRSR